MSNKVLFHKVLLSRGFYKFLVYIFSYRAKENARDQFVIGNDLLLDIVKIDTRKVYLPLILFSGLLHIFFLR